MKSHKALWRALCWASAILLMNAALTSCLSSEAKVENEPEWQDTTTVKALVDTVPVPIFKQDSLATTVVKDSAGTGSAEDSVMARIPRALAFGDSALSDTLYVKKGKEPIYKRWWFLAALGGAVVATLVAIASGDKDVERQDLPEFPDPPDR